MAASAVLSRQTRAVPTKPDPSVPRPVAPALPADRALAAIRVLTCGSVDDGKSTLIGRLLWDATELPDDTRAMVRRAAVKTGDPDTLDYSLLLDGLLAEREQGITIDIAWRSFDTADTRFTLIDSPGHEQYTRNMASGASHADVAVLLIDARHGIKPQTRRHLAILDTFGVRRVVLAVNKMDLVDWSEERFQSIAADFDLLRARFAFTEATAIPVSARTGDNVASKSAVHAWYRGPSLLDVLARPATVATAGPFRFPVQLVVRGANDFRGLAGTVTSGAIAVGDEIADTVSGRTARVARIVTMDRDLDRAVAGHAIVLQLDRDLDVSRGAVLSAADGRPVAARSLDARLVWLADQPFSIDQSYLLRTATDLVPIARLEITSLLDLVALNRRPATNAAANDIADVAIDLGRATGLDPFSAARGTGTVLIVDALTGATVAGGVAVTVAAVATSADLTGPRERTQPAAPFPLTRADLAHGVCADLGDSAADDREFARRAVAVAALMRRAGIAVVCDL
jgi:bifunctional enzyme CysN/CysC